MYEEEATCSDQRMMSLKTAMGIVDAWLCATFQGGGHKRGIDEIEVSNRRRGTTA